MKKISLILVILLLLLSTFSFANAQYINEATDVLKKMQIVIGDEHGDLMLDKNFTRAEFATVIVRLLNLQEKNGENKIDFSDVSTSFWGYSNIYKCVNAGYLIGDGDNKFRPNDPIKYEEVLTILIRILNKEEPNMNWPDDYISKSENLGITKNTNLEKKQNINRGNSFILVYNSLNIKI